MRKRRPIPPRSLGRIVAAAIVACLPVWAGVAEDADRAWISGDHTTALELYDRVLDEQPKNFQALLRSAKILSWNGRFDEAIERYDRAIAVDPDDREAAFGRALTLSWDGQLDRAIDALDRLDERYAGDREIRLARARAESWDGRFKDARAGFKTLLEEDASDVDAMLGLARTYAWAGRSPQARDAYQGVVDTDPGNVDARIGLAYLDLWAGEIGSAAKQAAELKQEHPDNEEVAKLDDQVSRSAGAWWSVDVSQIDDTDDNRLRRYLVSGGFGLGRQVRLDVGVGRYEMSDPTGEASIDSVHTILSFYPGTGQRVSARVGYDRRTRTDDTTDNDVLGGLSYSWGLDRRWQVHASAMRIPIRYAPVITDAGITFDRVELRTSGAVGERFRVHAAVGTADFSDDNSRKTASAGFLYKVPVRKVTMHVGYSASAMDYDQDLSNGYFDPQDFIAHLAQLRVSDEYGNRGNYYRLQLDTGLQSFTLSGVDVNDDTVLVIGATLGFAVAKRMKLEAYVEHGDYAAATASGFESTAVGLRLLWRAGL